MKTCPYCGATLTERRGRIGRGGKLIPDSRGYMIRSDCVPCGRFIGQRRIEARKVAGT